MRGRLGQIMAMGVGLASCQASPAPDTWTPVVPRSSAVDCTFEVTESGANVQFTALSAVPLGEEPSTVWLPADAETQYENPAPEDADTYVRAASGIKIYGVSDSDEPPFSLAVVQDSRSRVGNVTVASSIADVATNAPIIDDIDMWSTDSEEYEALYEDPSLDYKTYRKGYKRDYESISPLPDGRMLVLGSGSDVGENGADSRRAQAALLDPETGEVETYSLLSFYSTLLADDDFIGVVGANAQREINIEGAAVRVVDEVPTLALFNRANLAKNTYDVVVEYPLDAWLAYLTGASQDLPVRRLTKLYFETVEVDGQPFFINLNDGLFGTWAGAAGYLMPVGIETDYFDANGEHHDGDVVFAGLALWHGIDDIDTSTCVILQAPGDPEPGQVTQYGKLEGLATYNPSGSDLVTRNAYLPGQTILGVLDVDSEIVPSELKMLSIPSLDR